MNKAVMVRKALNLENLKKTLKQQGLKQENIVIEKKITVSAEEYNDLCRDFFKRRDYIVENGDIMYQDNDGWHCILVCTEGQDTGIGISAEGYDFARHACEVKLSEITVKPDEKVIWHCREATDEILEKFNVKIIKRCGRYIIDQTNTDNLLRLNLEWKNNNAVWLVEIFLNPRFKSIKEITEYTGTLIKYKYALKKLQEIGLSYEVLLNE